MGTQHDRLRVPEAPSRSASVCLLPRPRAWACASREARLLWRRGLAATGLGRNFGNLNTWGRGAASPHLRAPGAPATRLPTCTHMSRVMPTYTRVHTSTCPHITRMSRDLSKAKTVFHCLQTKR